MARELRAPFPEQAYGCQNEHIETAAGDSRLCRDLQPALSAPVSRAALGASRLACVPERLAKAKAEYQDRHAGPHEHPIPGENQLREASSRSGSRTPNALTWVVPRRTKRTVYGVPALAGQRRFRPGSPSVSSHHQKTIPCRLKPGPHTWLFRTTSARY